MNIFDRNPLMTHNDVVYESPELKQRVANLFGPVEPRPTLFWGKAGTGKTTLCNLLAAHLVGPGHASNIKMINVPLYPTKAALCDQIMNFRGFGKFNKLGKAIVVLEELDGAEPKAQLALKVLLEDQSEHQFFLATTNSLSNINEHLADRFTKLHMKRSEPIQWIRRAQSVLQNEGVQITDEICLKLLEGHAHGESGRVVMGLLDEYAQLVNPKIVQR